jgi:HK97 gp10 family phage protein
MEIEIKNLEEFKKYMKEKQEKIKRIIPESVKKATFHVHNKVKESIARGTNAPVAVDTGRFLNSVDFDVVGDNESRVFSELDYANLIEYGTSKMHPRPHFKNTALKEKDKVRDIMNAEIKTI